MVNCVRSWPKTKSYIRPCTLTLYNNFCNLQTSVMDKEQTETDNVPSRKMDKFVYMTDDEKQNAVKGLQKVTLYHNVIKPMAKDMPLFVGGVVCCVLILPVAARYMKTNEHLSDRLLDISSGLQAFTVGSLFYYMLKNGSNAKKEEEMKYQQAEAMNAQEVVNDKS